MWVWVQKIAIPHQQAESAATGSPRGNLSDLYPRWLGSRELLLHHRDPYGSDLTREIQMGYYGRALDPARPNDPKDQQAFAYPVYVAFLLAPSVEMPFAIVQRIFVWMLVAITALSVPLWMQALGWRVSWHAKIIWILLTLSCFPAIQGIKLQQLSLLVAALIALAMWALARRQFVPAGILLALSTIKPQLVALPILWFCIWIVGNWRRRQRVFWSFAVAFGILVIAGEVVLPGWIGEFRHALADYYRYTGGGKSVLDVSLSPALGRQLSAILILVFALLAWRARKAPEDSPEFQWTFSLALAITLVVIPMFAPYNQLLLLPALMVIGRSVRELWRTNALSRFFIAVTAVAIFFPWLGAVLLALALVFLPAETVQSAWELPFYTNFAVPVTILALLLVARRVSLDQHQDPPARI